jgi:hypothetical protein
MAGERRYSSLRNAGPFAAKKGRKIGLLRKKASAAMDGV